MLSSWAANSRLVVINRTSPENMFWSGTKTSTIFLPQMVWHCVIAHYFAFDYNRLVFSVFGVTNHRKSYCQWTVDWNYGHWCLFSSGTVMISVLSSFLADEKFSVWSPITTKHILHSWFMNKSAPCRNNNSERLTETMGTDHEWAVS